MKKFIRKFLGMLIISFLAIISIVWLMGYAVRNKLLFVSNSLSYNAKAAQAVKSPQFNNAKLLLIGSSMTLNNISATLLEDSLQLPVYNFSSWGAKLDEMTDIVQQKNQYLYMNISFVDLIKGGIDEKYGYPINQNKILLELNMLEDFPTFIDQVHNFEMYTNKGSSLDYMNLNFDSCGSALFKKDGFHISENRWDQKPAAFSTEDEDRFITSLEKIKLHNKKITIIISFSPSREVFYDKNESLKINSFFNRIKEACQNTYCFNYYGLQYPDSLFADHAHFNDQGAVMFSTLIAKNIQYIIKVNRP
jgi:hypothetical protein